MTRYQIRTIYDLLGSQVISIDIGLEYYKIFYYVAKYGGITFAAEQLCISQPAVSQAVKQLEQALGAVLFLRTPKGAKLTPEGELLYSYVSRGYETILLGTQKLKEMVNLEHGEIRVGASDMTLQFYLLPFLERFHEKYPKIKVNVTNGPTPETLTYLEEGKIDFGIVTSPVPNRHGLSITPVREIEDVFVAGPRFQKLKASKLDYHCLETLPMICLEPNTSTRQFLNHFLAANQVVLQPEFELATSDMIVQFAVRNLGIGSVVKDFANQALSTGELFSLSFIEKVPKRHMCLVCSSNNPVSGAALKLLKMIEQKAVSEEWDMQNESYMK